MARITALAVALFISVHCNSGEAARRNAERQARAAAIKSLDAIGKKSMAPYITALNGIGQWLVAQKAASDAANIAVEIQTIDDAHPLFVSLKKSIDEIKEPAILDEAKQKELAQKLKAAKKARATGLFDLATTCFRAGLSAKAYQHVQAVLEIDPDHPGARQALGHVKTPAGWQTPFAAVQMQKGNVYVPEYGWVVKQAAEKAKSGEWFENGRWMPIADADTMHSSAALPWVIETQHFILKSTAPRKESVKLAEHLDAFRQLCHKTYLDFFLRGVDRRSGQMSFNQQHQKKMQVTYFGDKKDFEAVVRREVKGPLAALISLLPGIYYAPEQTLYFSRLNENPFFVFFFNHELTTQILTSHAQSGPAPIKAWITKAASQALLYATLGDDGKMTLTLGKQHSDVVEAANVLMNGQFPAISTLMALDNDAFNRPPQNETNNRICGAFCVFMLEFKDGIYAQDFLEFLYDSYRGARTANLSEYLGMDMQEIDKAFLDYIAAAK